MVGRWRLFRAQRAGLSVLLPPGESGRDRTDRYVYLSAVDAVLEEYKYEFEYEHEYADVSVGMANRSSRTLCRVRSLQVYPRIGANTMERMARISQVGREAAPGEQRYQRQGGNGGLGSREGATAQQGRSQ